MAYYLHKKERLEPRSGWYKQVSKHYKDRQQTTKQKQK